MQVKINKILLIIGIVLMIGIVQAQEESTLDEIPASSYPEGEGYITLPPEDIILEESPAYKTDPDSDDILETVTVDPEELFGNDYEEVILVNESEREIFPPGVDEIVRPAVIENRSGGTSLLIKIAIAIIIILIILWGISRFRR